MDLCLTSRLSAGKIVGRRPSGCQCWDGREWEIGERLGTTESVISEYIGKFKTEDSDIFVLRR